VAFYHKLLVSNFDKTQYEDLVTQINGKTAERFPFLSSTKIRSKATNASECEKRRKLRQTRSNMRNNSMAKGKTPKAFIY
jgi:hypothetical protein